MHHRLALTALFALALVLPAEAVAFHRQPEVAPFPVAANELATGPDGAVWFTHRTRREVGRMTTTGEATMYPLPASATPGPITAGPDGALWFTDEGGKVWRLTTAGELTSFALPGVSAGVGFYDIVAGPDGALWFTFLNDAIGRITTAGEFQRFTFSGPRTPRAITPGPDGALWFNTRLDRKIGRITTGGEITEYDLPADFPESQGDLSSGGITNGPDGALWFTNGGDEVGRITTAGLFERLPLTSEGLQAESIVTLPDGSLWFSSATSTAGRITTTGEHALHGPFGRQTGLIFGPADSVWFAQAGVGITRVSPPPNPAHPVLSELSLSLVEIRVGKGTTIRFTLSAPATVRLTVAGLAGSETVAGKPGANSKRLKKGRFAGRKLKPGRYRLVARATDAEGDPSATLKTKFRVLKPLKG